MNDSVNVISLLVTCFLVQK